MITTTIGTLLALLREEGPQALFRGVVPALVLVANPILQYTLFEQLKNLVERRQRSRGQGAGRITPTMAFFLGALGKLFATSITYPYITVKSRMHVADGAERKEGVTRALARVVREEGYSGLYKGKFGLLCSYRLLSVDSWLLPCCPLCPRHRRRQTDKGYAVL